MAQVISNLGSPKAFQGGGVRTRSSNGVRTSYIGEGLVTLFNRVQEWSERRRTRGQLYQMPDYMLHDIGVSRSDVETEYQKPFWRA